MSVPQGRSPGPGSGPDAEPDEHDGVEITAELAEGLGEVDAAEWDALAGTANPFVSHAFLHSLERTGCVGEETGWIPRHIIMRADGRLIAAAPLYLKFHSQGEFVFDHAFADAFERAGGQYYPKMVSSVPFTPCTGPRLLVGDAEGTPEGDALRGALAATAINFAKRLKLSSMHWLFPPQANTEVLERAGYALRSGCQFHWHNNDFKTFDDYLAALTSKRRKAVKRERREAAAAPVNVQVLRGHETTEEQWRAYHRLYASTYDRKWGYPSLTPEWFVSLGRDMPEQALLVLAERDGEYVAGAHLLVGEDALYGRNWGCSEQHRSLHFELCYYRPIEFCIEHGLKRFEAGAQGEHKLWRGFLPTTTWSAHWFAHDGLDDAVREFLGREQRGISGYIDDMAEHTPFRAQT